MNIVTANALKKIYGSGTNIVKALDHVTLEIEHGEFVTIIGTSGSGKSTLLHMLGGLDYPDSGEVIVDGQSLFTLSPDELTIFRRRKIGFIFQQFNLIPVLNVMKILFCQ